MREGKIRVIQYEIVEIKILFNSSLWHSLWKSLSYSNVLAHLSFTYDWVTIVLISGGLFLIHLQHALLSRVDEKQSLFTLSFPFLNPKPCLALHITSLTHSHTRAMQFLNTLPSGSAVSNTMRILLPGPTSLSFPFAFPYPPFFTKISYSSGKSRTNSASYSAAQKYSIFLSKVVQTDWWIWIFNIH